MSFVVQQVSLGTDWVGYGGIGRVGESHVDLDVR